MKKLKNERITESWPLICRGRIVKSTIIVLFLLSVIISRAEALEIPLTVEEPAGVERVSEPITSGIPLPKSLNILTVNNLGIFDGASEIPAQFKVTARWGGAPSDSTKPIKWLLVDFQASVGANTSKIYTLKDTGSGTAASGIAVSNNASSIIINSGEAEFTVSSTHFNLFDNVNIQDSSTGQLTKNILSSISNSGVSITRNSDNVTYSAADETISVTVEESGPLKVVVLATGRHQDTGGASLFDWKVRMHFYKGKSYVRVFYTITDKQDIPNITQNIPLKEITLMTKANLAADPIYTIAGNTGTPNIFTGTLLSGQTASLLQTGTIDQTGSIANDENSAAITYSVTGPVSGSGQWSRGWADISDGTRGMTVAVNYFWQLYPKQFRLNSDGSLNIDLWPSTATPFLMWAAAQKTHELLYYFHNGTAAQANSENLVSGLFGIDTSYGPGTSKHHKLLAVAPSTWYANSRVFGDIGIRDLTAYPGVHQPLVTKYFNNVDALLERSLRERYSGGTRGGGHEYMFWNFGDSRDATWSNMAYDTLQADAIHFAISGDRRFLDHLQEVAQHWRDVDVEHSILDTNPPETKRTGFTGTAPYLGKSKFNPNQGGEHDLGSFGRVGFNLEHLKGQGLADHYFLTGDALSKDVLAETYNYYNMWNEIEKWANWGATRTWSNMLAIVTAYYEVSGSSEAKARADYIVTKADAYQRRVTSAMNPGLIWVTSSTNPPDVTSSFVNGHTMDILLNYMIQVPNSRDVTQNIIDAVNFEINDSRLWTGSHFNCWTGDNYGITNATACDYMAIGGFGFAYQKTGNTNILNIAKTALSNAIDQASENSNLKPYTQKTRIPPGFLYYLMAQVPSVDTILPTTPTDLTATSISSSQINLSWTASTDDVGVTGYRLERCQGLTCTNFTQIATSTGTSYTDTGLLASTAYRYQVRAVDRAGNLSDYSAISSATTEPAGATLKGDVNCDKAVDVLDVQALVNCILDTGSCDWGCGNSADVNKDGSVDVLDVQEVVNIILGR